MDYPNVIICMEPPSLNISHGCTCKIAVRINIWNCIEYNIKTALKSKGRSVQSKTDESMLTGTLADLFLLVHDCNEEVS